mgnify:FL=1
MKDLRKYIGFYPHTLTNSPESPCLSTFQGVRVSVRGVRVDVRVILR